MMACGLTHVSPRPQNPTSCLPVSVPMEKPGLNGQSSGKILAQIDLSLYIRSHPPTCPLL